MAPDVLDVDRDKVFDALFNAEVKVRVRVRVNTSGHQVHGEVSSLCVHAVHLVIFEMLNFGCKQKLILSLVCVSFSGLCM